MLTATNTPKQGDIVSVDREGMANKQIPALVNVKKVNGNYLVVIINAYGDLVEIPSHRCTFVEHGLKPQFF